MLRPPSLIGVAEEKPNMVGEKLLEEMKKRLHRKYGSLGKAWKQEMLRDVAVPGNGSVEGGPTAQSILAAAKAEKAEAEKTEEAKHVEGNEGSQDGEVDAKDSQDESRWRDTRPKASKTRFMQVFRKVGIKGDAEVAWHAMGIKGDEFSLSDFDRDVKQDLDELRERLVQRYGSLVKAFSELDVNGSFQLEYKDFLRLCYEVQFRRNERRLFECLAQEGLPDQVSPVMSLAAIDEEAVRKVIEDRDAKKATEAADGDQLSESVETKAKARDPVRAFREVLMRRFGNMLRAWKAIDNEGKNVLTRSEFIQALPATGYGGGPQLLFDALLAAKGPPLRKSKKFRKNWQSVCYRDVDPEGFELLLQFRTAFMRDLESLAEAFRPGKEFSRNDFYTLCRKAQCPQPWDPVFDLLDASGRGRVCWDDVRFLEERWSWKDDLGSPIRLPGLPYTRGRSEGLPPRVEGIGHLATSMRPAKVSMTTIRRSSMSLPDLRRPSSPLRSNWNDRHQVVDTRSNKTEQMVHWLGKVQREENEKIRRKVAYKLLEVPTAEWLQEHVAKSRLGLQN